MHKTLIGILVMMIGISSAWAYRAGNPVASRHGSATVIEIPIEMAQGEELISAAVAPVATYDALKQPRPNIFKTAKVTQIKSGALTSIRIEGGEAAAPGGRIAILLDVVTNTGQSMKQLFADIPPVEVKPAPRAAAPVARQGAATVNSSDPLLRVSDFDAQMQDLNNHIAAVTAQVGALAESMRADMAKQAARDAAAVTRDAALLEALKPKPVESQDEEFLLVAIAAIMGAGIASAYLSGRKTLFSPGQRIHLTRLDGNTIEAEFLTVQTASHDKALPYRIADILTGAPRQVMIRQLEDSGELLAVNHGTTIEHEDQVITFAPPPPSKPHVKFAAGAWSGQQQKETVAA